MKRVYAIAAIAALCVTLLASGVAAQRSQVMPNLDAAIDRLYLGCIVDRQQELIITNTTAASIPASTAIWFNVKVAGQPDQTEYIYPPALAPGASFRIPFRPAASCTAWLKITPMMAPVE